MGLFSNKLKMKLFEIPFWGAHFIQPYIVKREGGQKESKSLRSYFKDKYNTSVGLYSYGGCFSESFNVGGKVTIGKYCSLAQNIKYYGANHPIRQVSTSPYFYNKSFGFNVNDVERKSLVIGNDVWIGGNVVITSNCREIGNGSVIGAGSIVTKNIPNYAIAVGNPARVIGYRFSDYEISILEGSEWWNMTPQQLVKYYDYMNSPIDFVRAIQNDC